MLELKAAYASAARQEMRACRVYRVKDVAVAARRVCNEGRKLYTVAWRSGVRLGVVDVRVRRRRGAGARSARWYYPRLSRQQLHRDAV
jgi:hypothetical protein